jgi:class 3 adenylate cyclase
MYLEWTDEKGQARRLEIGDRVHIGRTCKGIDDAKRILVCHPIVSGDHAVIRPRGSHLQITDMSKNGTWINDVRLAPGASQDLVDGDTIRVATTSIRLKCPDPVADDDDGTGTDRTLIRPMEVVVTNLVADIRGSSRMAQKEASSHVYALMKEVFETFSGVACRFRGTIKDYVGDAVYAFWDHGVAPNPKVALLACEAAFKQIEAVGQIREKLSGTNPAVQYLRLGWGITTGRVTMSHYGSRVADLALVGDCTNLAFRLSGIANKELSSKIVVCSETEALLREASVSVTDLGFVPVRGRKGEEHVFGVSASPSED